MLNEELDADLPYNEYFQYFGPDFKLYEPTSIPLVFFVWLWRAQIPRWGCSASPDWQFLAHGMREAAVPRQQPRGSVTGIVSN